MQQTKEIYALNYSLWGFVHEAARKNLHAARQSFGLPVETLEAIAQFNDQRLRKLCSETLVFFSIKASEALTLEETVAAQRTENSWELQAEADFAQLWWLSLGKLAAIDPLMSAQIFGISAQFAKRVASMSMHAIMQASAAKHSKFSLRFNPAFIKPILNGQNVSAHLFLKIHQQALSRSI